MDPTSRQLNLDNKEDPLLLNQRDLWIGRILPFLGPGQYLFVAGVNPKLKKLYQDYFATIPNDKLPLVQQSNKENSNKAVVSNTFYSSAFFSLSCAQYWHQHHSSGPSLQDAHVTIVVAKSGNLSVLDWIQQQGYPLSVDTFQAAARLGYKSILEYGQTKGFFLYPSVCAALAGGGHLSLLQWAHEQPGARLDWQTPVAAAASGHMDVLVYAVADPPGGGGAVLTDAVCAAAARNGRLEILQWLHEHHGMPVEWQSTICAAASRGHLAILHYAQEQGAALTDMALSAAAGGGHLNIVQWIHEDKAVPLDWKVVAAAAHSGHLDVLVYAHEQRGTPLPIGDAGFCSRVAANGHVHILQYIRERGCEWDARTTRMAARDGHADCLKYAHENGCSWDKEGVCTQAAMMGHLDVLIYARENGCPWDATTCYYAAQYGHLELLQYAHQHCCPWDKSTWEAAKGHPKILQYALDNGCPMD